MADVIKSPIENQCQREESDDLGLVDKSDSSTLTDEDTALLQTCCDWPTAGPRFYSLWRGAWQEWPEYPSQSEADNALIYMLSGPSWDINQIERIFMASGLGERLRTGRKKKHDRYFTDMVSAAFRDVKGPVAKIELAGEWVKVMTKQETKSPQIENRAAWQPSQKQVMVKGFNEMTIEKTKWLWPNYLPIGKLAILAGVGSAGKSTLTLKMAATVSSGGMWPDNTRALQGDVLLWSGEDIAAEDVLPRLVAMGADLKRVHNIAGVRNEKGEIEPFNPIRDIPLIKKMLKQYPGVSMLVISPLVAMVKGDMNASNITREGLQALVDLANETNVCVLGITHFRKDSYGDSPVDRVLGSAAFTQLARVVIGAVRSPDGKRRALAVIKGNNSKEGLGAYEYEIKGHAVEHQGIKFSEDECSVIAWGNNVEGNAQEIFNDIEGVETKRKKRESDFETAVRLISEKLANGVQIATKDLDDYMLKTIGIKKAVYAQAKIALHVQSRPQTGAAGLPWVSSIPNAQIDIPPANSNWATGTQIHGPN